MGGCQVDHPKIVEALDQLHGRANAMQITAWRKEGDGELRYVWAKTNGESVLLTLLGSEQGQDRLRTLAASLKSAAGVYVGVREGEGNAMRGDEALVHACGVSELPYEDAGVHESIGPLGFLQPNPAVAHAAYKALVSDLGGTPLEGQLAFDLYAGAGVTTSRLRGRFASVRPVEAFPESAEALGVPAQDVGDFLTGYEGERPELIIANPPRAGFGARVCEKLLALGAKRLQVMSCSPDSFARDLKRLSASYELERLELFDTLPQTAHVELVAWQLRSRRAGSRRWRPTAQTCVPTPCGRTRLRENRARTHDGVVSALA
jgi:23S rRNA (uracil1939-C5)-methyltransferase